MKNRSPNQTGMPPGTTSQRRPHHQAVSVASFPPEVPATHTRTDRMTLGNLSPPPGRPAIDGGFTRQKQRHSTSFNFRNSNNSRPKEVLILNLAKSDFGAGFAARFSLRIHPGDSETHHAGKLPPDPKNPNANNASHQSAPNVQKTLHI